MLVTYCSWLASSFRRAGPQSDLLHRCILILIPESLNRLPRYGGMNYGLTGFQMETAGRLFRGLRTRPRDLNIELLVAAFKEESSLREI